MKNYKLNKSSIIRLSLLLLIVLFFIFVFGEYYTVLKDIKFAPLTYIEYPITVLEVSINERTFWSYELVILRAGVFIPYEVSTSTFDFTVEVRHEGSLILSLSSHRLCYSGELVNIDLSFKVNVPGGHIVIFKIYHENKVVYEKRFRITVI
mgnify:CR=1 FL=1